MVIRVFRVEVACERKKKKRSEEERKGKRKVEGGREVIVDNIFRKCVWLVVRRK